MQTVNAIDIVNALHHLHLDLQWRDIHWIQLPSLDLEVYTLPIQIH